MADPINITPTTEIAKITLWDRFQAWRHPIDVKLVESKMSAMEKKLTEATFWKDRYQTLTTRNKSGLEDSRSKMYLSALYSQSKKKKDEILKDVDKYKDTYMHAGIVGLILDDSLAPAVTTNKVVEIVSENKTIKEALQSLHEKVDIDTVALNIADDLISYGEYFLEIESDENKGVLGIVDNVEQGSLVAVYENYMPKYFLRLARGAAGQYTISKRDPGSYAHFCLGSRKLKVKVEGKEQSEYIRIGRPLFWGTFDLLNNLMILTALVPASYVQKINNTSLIGITLPEGTDPEKAFLITRKYEDMLNQTTAFRNESGEVTIADVLASAGRFKAIPLFGGDKGLLQKVDPRYEEIMDVTVLEDIRKSICASIGVPYAFIYGSEGVAKSETLKSFARYVRRLSGIQQAIKYGLKQIAIVHCQKKGLNPTPQMIDVKFSNTLVSVEELDKIEFMDTLMQSVGNFVTNATDMATKLKTELDGKTMTEFLTRSLKMVNLEGLFKVLDDTIGETPEEEPGTEGF